VVEEFYCFSVQRKVVCVLIVEEVDGVFVQTKRKGLEKGDVVRHDFFVREVELVYNNGVDMVIGEEVVNGSLVSDVFKDDVESLENLDTDIASALLVDYFEKAGVHVSLEEEIKDGTVILVTPDQDLRYGSQGFH
jgi:hypothetical protein